jgi:hypothetical protein
MQPKAGKEGERGLLRGWGVGGAERQAAHIHRCPGNVAALVDVANGDGTSETVAKADSDQSNQVM